VYDCGSPIRLGSIITLEASQIQVDMRKITIIALFLLGSLFQACGRTADPATPLPSNQATSTTTATATLELVAPSPEPTPTELPAIGLLYAPEGAPPWIQAAVEETLAEQPGDPPLVWETRSTLVTPDLTDEIQLVVALPPNPDLGALVSAAPTTQFLAVGIAGLQAAPNLTQIGSAGLRPDKQAFLAGYLAAVITEDWRVGVLSPGDTAAGRAARQGFLNGVRFFCGLCLPEVPPYAGYPLFVDLQPAADQAAWKAAADLLLTDGVKTVYIEPAVDQEALRDYLGEGGVVLIGGAPLVARPANNWAASIRPDIQQALEEIWPGVFSGGAQDSAPLSFIISDVNEALVSPGRQRLVESLIPDLTSGLIDTGIDPLTGEIR
jgi:hypothetical protein